MNEKNLGESICVIGDKFKAFSAYPGLICFSDLLDQLRNYRHCGSLQRIILCQGINEEALDIIKRETKRYGNSIQIDEKISHRADLCFVHKHKAKNVQITTPQKIDHNIFSASLVTDENCELLDDHVSGIHVQGFTLIEAARQMHMAVTELYDLNEYQRGKYSYALNLLQSRFTSLLFPTAVDIKLTLRNSWDEKRESLTMHAKVEFSQMGQVGCEVTCEATGMPSEKFKTLERIRAVRLTRSLVKTLAEGIKTLELRV